MTTTINNIIDDAFTTLACVDIADLKALDHDTVVAMERDMRYFMSCLTTVAAQKRAQKSAEEETNKHIVERDAMLAAKENIQANIETFDNLDNLEKAKLINLGKVYHHARRANNFGGMEKIKTMILSNLLDLNLGNMFVLGHVIHLAK
jgi:hypothetical protein